MKAKLLDPIFDFDREVLPAGAFAPGQVYDVQPLPRLPHDDFTQVRSAGIEFTSLILPDGHKAAPHSGDTEPELLPDGTEEEPEARDATAGANDSDILATI
jgi:hypothetical protein